MVLTKSGVPPGRISGKFPKTHFSKLETAPRLVRANLVTRRAGRVAGEVRQFRSPHPPPPQFHVLKGGSLLRLLPCSQVRPEFRAISHCDFPPCSGGDRAAGVFIGGGPHRDPNLAACCCCLLGWGVVTPPAPTRDRPDQFAERG